MPSIRQLVPRNANSRCRPLEYALNMQDCRLYANSSCRIAVTAWPLVLLPSDMQESYSQTLRRRQARNAPSEYEWAPENASHERDAQRIRDYSDYPNPAYP